MTKNQNPVKLRETYNLRSMIEKVHASGVRLDFDMADVFTVVICDTVEPAKLLCTVDLYKEDGTVTEKEVAISNHFFSKTCCW
jgi:hypothetical protein